MTWLPVLLASLLVCGCADEQASAAARPERTAPVSASAAAAGPATTTPSVEPTPAAEPSGSSKPKSYDQRCEAADAELEALKLVELKLTSEVKDKRPVDEIDHAEPGKDVWAYMAIKNRSGKERCVTVTFRVNGKKRASVTLDVGESPAWRTWAHNRVLDSDGTGEVEVTIVDDQEKTLKKVTLPIAANREASSRQSAGQPEPSH